MSEEQEVRERSPLTVATTLSGHPTSTKRGHALYNYDAQEDDELNIQANDEFILIETYDDDWWLINLNGRVGVVPSNYVQLNDDDNDHAPNINKSTSPKLSTTQQRPPLPRSTSKGMITPSKSFTSKGLSFAEEVESPMPDTSMFADLISPPPKASQDPSQDKKQKKQNQKASNKDIEELYESSELSRLRNMREEASLKIDALRNTVSHLESQQPPLSANSSAQQLALPAPQTQQQALQKVKSSGVALHEEIIPTDTALVRKSASTKRLNPSTSTGTIQQVTLDPTSIEYISRVINEKMQREFASRDQRLIHQVHEIIQQSFVQFQQMQQLQGKPLYHPLISPHAPDHGHVEKDTPMSLPSHSRMIPHSKSNDEDQDYLSLDPRQPNNKPSSSSRAVFTKKQQDQMDKFGPSKIPKIKLPKVNNFTEQQQSQQQQQGKREKGLGVPSSSRSTKSNHSENMSLPPIHGGKNKSTVNHANNNNMNPAAMMMINKPIKEEMLSTEGVQYNPCRSVVYPSTQDVALLRNRHLIPPTKLQLRHVFGYDGDLHRHGNTTKGKNVLWLRSSQQSSPHREHSHRKSSLIIAYPASSIVVLTNLGYHNAQSFFTGHTDDVVGLCQHPSLPILASCQIGVGLILIWSYERLLAAKHRMGVTTDRADGAEISLPSTVRGVSAVDFSPDGKLLLACSMEEVRSVYIYDWRKTNLLTSCKVGHIDVCQFYFNPYAYTPFEENDGIGSNASIKSNKGQILPPTGCYTLTSFGGKQVKFWTIKAQYTSPTSSSNNNQPQERDYRGKQFKQKILKHVIEGTQGSISKKQQNSLDFTSCTFIPTQLHEHDCRIILGTSTGAIHIWHQLLENSNEEDFLPLSWLAKGKLLMIVTDAHESPIVDMDFFSNPNTHDVMDRLISTDQSGIINVWNVSYSNDSKESIALEHLGGMQLEESYARSIAYDREGEHIILGTANNSILLMTLKDMEVHDNRKKNDDNVALEFDIVPVGTSHNSKVRKLTIHPVIDSIFASIGNDRTIHIWDGNDRQHLSCVDLEHPATAVCFSTDGNSIAIGNDRNELLVLSSPQFQDYIVQRSQQALRKSKRANVEIPMMEWQLVDSRVLAPSGGGGSTKNNQKKHEITEIKFSPNGEILAVGCKDNFIHLLANSAGYRHVGVCKGHTSYIKNIDFSEDGRVMKTVDAAKELLHWDVESKQRITNNAVYRDLQWYTHSCIYGWGLQGIFNRWDGEKFLPPDNEINAVCRSLDGNFIACSGSHTVRSAIKLFAYPCLPDGVPSQHGGHTSPVLDLAFIRCHTSMKGMNLVSAGGNDSCIFLWDVVTNEQAR